MKIERYIKNKNGMYAVVIDNNKYKIHEDLILKYSLLLSQDIDKSLLDTILNENIYYEAYTIAINAINKRIRTGNELLSILSKKGIDSCIGKEVIKKLKYQGYINDAVFVDSYVHDKMVLSNNGPLRIRRELLNLGIDEEVIDQKLGVFTYEEEAIRIKKIVEKNIKTNKKSLYMFKMKMKNYLIDLGYNFEPISLVLDAIKFDDEVNRKKEYEAIYKKYSKKYDGAELEYRVKQALYQKGFK